MSEFLSTVRSFWFTRRTQVEGIHSFGQWKFYFVFLLYMGSLLCFAHDPFFLDHGHFLFSRQNFITVFLAYVIGASFCWEHPVFGKSSGANLLLQCLMMFPLALFIARILVLPPAHTPFQEGVESVLDFIKSKIFDPGRVIPKWIQQIFQNWKLSLFAILVVTGLSLKRLQWRISAILALLIVPLAITVTEGGELRWLTAGLLLFLFGLTLQYCRYDRIIYYENVTRRLVAEGGDKMMLNLISKIMVQLEERKSITEKNLLVLVRDEYQKIGNYTDVEYRMIATEIIQQMIYKFNFIAIRNDINGLVAVANPALWDNDHLLTGITVIPRMIIIALLMIGWMLSPIDLIPDSIPLVGALDDIAVALISSMVLKRTTAEMLSGNQARTT